MVVYLSKSNIQKGTQSTGQKSCLYGILESEGTVHRNLLRKQRTHKERRISWNYKLIG